MNRLHPLMLACAAALSACAAGGEFPSLAPRPVELEESAAPTEPAPPVSEAVDPQLAARLADLLADARRGQVEFEAVLPAATDAVAGAGEAGSEGWILAQQAISRLEAERAPTAIALADLDRLAIAHAGEPELPAVIAARDEARALAEAQAQRIGVLREQLSPL